MTVEQHLLKIQEEYDKLSQAAKERSIEVGGEYMSLRELLDEISQAFSRLNERQKANLHIDEDGFVVGTGNMEKTLFELAAGKFI